LRITISHSARQIGNGYKIASAFAGRQRLNLDSIFESAHCGH
jgi:hypothetical protein